MIGHESELHVFLGGAERKQFTVTPFKQTSLPDTSSLRARHKKAKRNQMVGELKSGVTVEVGVRCSPSLIIPMVCVDVKQY